MRTLIKKMVEYELIEHNYNKRGVCYVEIEIEDKRFIGVLKEVK